MKNSLRVCGKLWWDWYILLKSKCWNKTSSQSSLWISSFKSNQSNLWTKKEECHSLSSLYDIYGSESIAFPNTRKLFRAIWVLDYNILQFTVENWASRLIFRINIFDKQILCSGIILIMYESVFIVLVKKITFSGKVLFCNFILAMTDSIALPRKYKLKFMTSFERFNKNEQKWDKNVFLFNSPLSIIQVQ